MSAFDHMVTLSCEARVGAETLRVRQSIAAPVYDDPEARKFVEEAVRRALMLEILKKWTPVIKVRRSQTRTRQSPR